MPPPTPLFLPSFPPSFLPPSQEATFRDVVVLYRKAVPSSGVKQSEMEIVASADPKFLQVQRLWFDGLLLFFLFLLLLLLLFFCPAGPLVLFCLALLSLCASPPRPACLPACRPACRPATPHLPSCHPNLTTVAATPPPPPSAAQHSDQTLHRHPPRRRGDGAARQGEVGWGGGWADAGMWIVCGAVHVDVALACGLLWGSGGSSWVGPPGSVVGSRRLRFFLGAHGCV